MSQENVEIARKGYDALNQGGVEAVLPYFDRAIEIEVSADTSPEPQTLRGHEGVRRWFAMAAEVLDEIRFEPVEFIGAGDQVVVPGRMIGIGRASGVKAEQSVTQVWTLREGLAIRMSTYLDKQSALEALGLSEQDAHADS